MFTRSFRARSGAAAVAAVATAALALTVGPANADPTFTPNATDIVGVGSDTTQFAVTNLADGATVSGSHVAGYNESAAVGAPKIASFDACVQSGSTCTSGGTITLRSGATPITRPNGSGAGKALLFGAGNDNNVTFARSSSALNAGEKSAGLYTYPFAVDTLVMVTSKNVASHAPSALTGQQILDIYKGTDTNWSQVDPTKSGVIKAFVPQTGSGTRSFFLAQLTALNGGTAPTLGSNVTDAQEHDPTLIQNDADAIAPFSLGRANLAGTVRVETGFNPQRALYNVVRSTGTNLDWNVGSTLLESVLGSDGFVCGNAARPLIEAAGFKQLQRPADGGVCGLPTQDAVSNLTVYNAAGSPSTVTVGVTPTTRAYGTSAVAHVSVTGAGGTPSGTATLTLGTFTSTVTLVDGAADVTLPASVAVGTRSVTASYSGDTNFTAANQSGSYVVTQAKSLTTPTCPTTISRGKRGICAVKVAITPAAATKPTGTVTIQRGSTVIGKGSLSGGAVRISLKALPVGKNRLLVTYVGNANVKTSGKFLYVTQK